MDSADARALISAGESLTTEFKRGKRNKFNDADLVEAVVCLANGRGGTLLIGVEDDGRITGADPRHETVTDPARVDALIANKTSPIVQTRTSVLDIDGHDVIVVEVPASARVTGTTDGKYVRRALRVDGAPECVPFPAHEMLAREIDRGAIDYASLPAYEAEWSDLDPLEFDRFRRLATASNADPVVAALEGADICRALGVVTVEPDGTTRPSLGAVLLFGRPHAISRHIPNHETAFQVLSGLSIEVNVFTRDPLFKAAENLMARFQAWNREEEVEFGLLRVAIPLVPETAAREVIANALVHRDYTAMGAVRVEIADDAFTVTSPGGFPPGVQLDNLLTMSQPRSPILADAFRRAGIVDRSGRGINKMYASLLRVGREAPDYSRSTTTAVTAVIPLGDADLALARLVAQQESKTGKQMNLFGLQILHELRVDPKLSIPEIATHLRITEGEARAGIGRMVDSGLIEMHGTGRGRTYHLSSAVYQALDNQSAYVRVRGTDTIQREQMVLQYVAAYGSITRAQAAELCLISPGTASTLLRTMARKGLLELRGSRRTSHYVAPSG
ncbi:RNA-binding domain-containing protein [Prescottella agglutinans]|uniref:RNA-binding domain-containing protein n=1 Tax=Prescottella agglutinans TaxID=1644129 RepID=UPI003D99AE97